MKHTTESLAAMSDFEVNKVLAKIICKSHITYTSGFSEMVCADNVKVDYCNNWNDIMPLCVEYDIIHDYHINSNNQKRYYTFHKETGFTSPWADKLPRAIAYSVIMVLENRQ